MDNKKIELLNILLQLMELYPNMRLGQLVTNVAYWAKGPTKEAVWEVTDEEWLAAAKKNINSHRTMCK